MSNQRYINKTTVLAVVFVIITLLWYSFFSTVKIHQPKKGIEKDRLSNTTFNHSAINNTYGFNPHVPYFIGFSKLQEYNIPTSDLEYIEGMISNYTLYTLKEYRAKISYVDASLKPLSTGTVLTKYKFQFGVNNANQHQVMVDYDIVENTLVIKIFDKNNKEVISKTFNRT